MPARSVLCFDRGRSVPSDRFAPPCAQLSSRTRSRFLRTAVRNLPFSLSLEFFPRQGTLSSVPHCCGMSAALAAEGHFTYGLA